MLKISNVSKSFGDVVALKNLTFEIGDGEFVFFVGPSGSGKTTLMRLILRDLLPDTGKIFVDKIDVTSLKNSEIPEYRRQIGFVFQDFKVLSERTVKENVEVALAVNKIDLVEWDKKTGKALKEVGLEDKGDFFPAQLSGGELQRVSLARAIVADPKIILADEPTGNLDWDTSFEIMKLFENISKKGKTVVMATHHRLIVDKMKKKVITLESTKDLSTKPSKKVKSKTKKS